MLGNQHLPKETSIQNQILSQGISPFSPLNDRLRNIQQQQQQEESDDDLLDNDCNIDNQEGGDEDFYSQLNSPITQQSQIFQSSINQYQKSQGMNGLMTKHEKQRQNVTAGQQQNNNSLINADLQNLEQKHSQKSPTYSKTNSQQNNQTTLQQSNSQTQLGLNSNNNGLIQYQQVSTQSTNNNSSKANINDEKISQTKTNSSANMNNIIQKQSFSLRNFSKQAQNSADPKLTQNQTSNITPTTLVSKFSSTQIQQQQLQKKGVYNIREAIQKNDLIRIRNGSPGSRSKQQSFIQQFEDSGQYIDTNTQPTSSFVNTYNNPLDPTSTATHQKSPHYTQNPDHFGRKRSFEMEMQDHGIIDDIQEIGRFNYVLLSRSADFEQFDETQLGNMCNQDKYIGNFKQGSVVHNNSNSGMNNSQQNAQNNTMPNSIHQVQNQTNTVGVNYNTITTSSDQQNFNSQTGGDKQNQQQPQKSSQKYMFSYQRRIKSISPPRLQICNENYIVYS